MTTTTLGSSLSTSVRIVCLLTALAGAVTGGILFAFSTFVLPALNRLPAGEAVSAMQAINERAPRSLLMLPLLASPLGCLVVGAQTLLRHGTGQRGWLLVGAVTGILAFAVTAAYHVPHNNALAELDPRAPDIGTRWRSYASGWATWNHARSGLAIASAVALMLGVVRAASR